MLDNALITFLPAVTKYLTKAIYGGKAQFSSHYEDEVHHGEEGILEGKG